MAYPTSVGVQSWLFSSAGPFISSAGNTYFLGENPSNSAQLLVRKASDPSSTWSTAATETPSSGQLACVDACQDGDVLHVVVSQNDLVLYRQFDMSSDAWLGSWTTVDSLTAGQVINNQQARIALADNGDLVVAYNDRDASFWYGVYAKYSTDDGATWSAEQTVYYDGSAKSAVLGDLVAGSNGRVHCFYTRTESTTTTSVRHRAIRRAAAPDIEDVADTDISSDSNSWVCNMPSGIQAGDLLVALVVADGNVTFTHTGWTLEDSGALVVASTGQFAVLSRIASGGDTLTVGVSANETGVVKVLRISNAAALELGDEDTDSSSPYNVSLVTPSWGAASPTLYISALAFGSNASTISAYPSDMPDDREYLAGTDSASGAVAIASATMTAANFDAGSWEWSTANSTRHYMLMVRGVAALGTDQEVVGTAGSASLATFAEYGPQTVGHGDSRDGAIVVPYVNNNARAAVITATPDSDTPTWSTAEVSAAAVERVGYFTDAHDSWLGAALSPAGEAFVAWIDASSNDVFYDTDRTGSFGTDTDFNNVTGIGVICRVVERSAGYFLALAWIDSSENFQYHEVQVGTKGTAEAAFSLTATADGEVTPGGETIEGTAEAAFTFVASAEGEVTPPTVEGEASADFTFTATGTGLVAHQATAVAAFTATMVAEGTVVKRASASAAFSFAATAEVRTTPRARVHFVFQAQFVPSPYVSPSPNRNLVVRSLSRRYRTMMRLGRRPR